jgi:hypothetical protein
MLLTLATLACPPVPSVFRPPSVFPMLKETAPTTADCARVLDAYLRGKYPEANIEMTQDSASGLVMCTVWHNRDLSDHWNLLVEAAGPDSSSLRLFMFTRTRDGYMPMGRTADKYEFLSHLQKQAGSREPH